MQCFSFLKTMMILFNFLIFVSMGVVGCSGLPMGGGHNHSRAQAGKWEIAGSRLCCILFPFS